jgi:hypothetical protein
MKGETMTSPADTIRTGTPCRSCGDANRPDVQCSWCGGFGIRTTMSGPDDCSHCGASGVQWPPLCNGCGKYRSMKGWT